MICRLALAAALLIAIGGSAAHAVEPSERLSDPALEARARALSRELRCLVCQNESIDESNADLAHDLRLLLRQRLAAGDTDRQVLDYVVARYGVFVLLDPPFEPATWLLWLGPPVLVLGAGGLLVLRSRRRRPEATLPVLTQEESARRAVAGRSSMIWFWIVAGLLVLAAVAVLLRPLLRQDGGNPGEDDAVVAIFRRQLTEIDAELAQGRLAAEQAAAARTEITRRLLAAVDRDRTAAGSAAAPPAGVSWRIGAAVGVAGLLPAAALALYFAVGAPAAIDRGRPAGAAAAAAGPHSAAELAAAADQLKVRLEREPGHVDGWLLLGRTFASLGRFAEARDAYAHAVALAPGEAKLHAELGEVLVLEAEGTVTPAAEAEFAKAADDPRSRFYNAEAALQHGDVAVAKSRLQALLADAPADAPWRKAVAARLAAIAPGEPPAGPPSTGPGAKDIAAAQSMSPEERQAMIRGMVERLAARLDQHPDDKEGWARLAHAYDVLGETDKAQAARAHAAAAASPSDRR